jgi:hypothetical protein
MASRLTPGILALIACGDIALVVGVLAAGHLLPLGRPLAFVFLALGVCLNGAAVLRVVRASRNGQS